MTRRSAYAALILLASTSAALAQTHTSPRGTNSAGTAQSSGPNRASGVTTGAGLGSGRSAAEPTTNADAAVKAENELLDRKLKSICRGC